ncbi:MAG: hypothetical protein BroJett006_13080 [Betaproteobacteria bacterium]|nr:MAG: hypothetical protein BroJett006_13080 [Betaproteobacteria bacterium]
MNQSRLDNWPSHYPWIEAEDYNYFRGRITEAPRDVANGLRMTLGHFNTRGLQERALNILQFKLDVLRVMVDAMVLVYCRLRSRAGVAISPCTGRRRNRIMKIIRPARRNPAGWVPATSR